MTKSKGSATPPQITSVDDLLAKMRMGTKDTFEISMRAFTFTVRVLSLDEMNDIRRASIAATARNSGDSTDQKVEMQKTTLRLASNIDGGVPFLNDSLLKKMTMDEINFIYEEYITVCDSVNPSMQSLSKEEFTEIVQALKKNQISSKDCSLRQLRAICTAYQDLIQRQEDPT